MEKEKNYKEDPQVSATILDFMKHSNQVVKGKIMTQSLKYNSEQEDHPPVCDSCEKTESVVFNAEEAEAMYILLTSRPSIFSKVVYNAFWEFANSGKYSTDELINLKKRIEQRIKRQSGLRNKSKMESKGLDFNSILDRYLADSYENPRIKNKEKETDERKTADTE